MNTVALKAGDEVLVHSRKRTAPIEQHEGEPDEKKGKTEKEQGAKEAEDTGKVGKGKQGKGKQGKGRGKTKK